MNGRVAMYLLLAAIGLVATWYFNLEFLRHGGSLAPGPFFAAVNANALTTAITIDVYWSAVVFSVWAWLSRTKPHAPSPYVYIVVCFAIGLAVAFPLYLAAWASRESRER